MRRILIVEDEHDVRDFFTRAVRRFLPNCDIIAVANGADALRVFQSENCDLIISDLRMPVMSGMELLRAVRATAPDVPFIVISADVCAEQSARAAGATMFLHKPVSLNQLQQVITKILRGETS